MRARWLMTAICRPVCTWFLYSLRFLEVWTQLLSLLHLLWSGRSQLWGPKTARHSEPFGVHREGSYWDGAAKTKKIQQEMQLHVKALFLPGLVWQGNDGDSAVMPLSFALEFHLEQKASACQQWLVIRQFHGWEIQCIFISPSKWIF